MFRFRKPKSPDALAVEACTFISTFYLNINQELTSHGLKSEWMFVDKGLYWGIALATETAAAIMLAHPRITLSNFQRFRDRLINLSIDQIHGMIYPERAQTTWQARNEGSFNSYFPTALKCYEKVRDARLNFAEMIAIVRQENTNAYYELIAGNGLNQICEYPGGDMLPTPEGKRRFDAVIEVAKPKIGLAVMQMQSDLSKLLASNVESLEV